MLPDIWRVMVLRIPKSVLVYFWVFSPSICAQQATTIPANEQPAAVLRTTTRAVVLDAVVTDPAGRAVSDLSKADFSIFEDGQRQEIASFESAGVHLHPSTERDRSRTILILDEMNSGFTDLAYARYAVERLFRRNSGILDGPTSLMALTNAGLVQLHEYTQDGNQLLRTLDEHQSAYPWRLHTGTEGLSERLGMSVGAVEEIAFAGSDFQTRKNIVWISPGFPVLEKIEASSAARAKLFDAVRRLSDDLLRARITMYTVDPRGAATGGSPLDTDVVAYFHGYEPGSTTTIADLALERLAVETGGKVLRGRNDVDAEIEEPLAISGFS